MDEGKLTDLLLTVLYSIVFTMERVNQGSINRTNKQRKRRLLTLSQGISYYG